MLQENFITESPNAMDSSKPFTPSRILPLTDTSEVGDISSHTSTQAQVSEPDVKPMPMPKRRQRFTTQTIFRPTPPTSAAPPKKDAKPKPYTLDPPAIAPQYRVMGKGEAHGRTNTLTTGTGAQVTVAYADFMPWNGHQPEDRLSKERVL
jgi:mediator of RNA polymerase II transcription subunit 12, fungi type